MGRNPLSKNAVLAYRMRTSKAVVWGGRLAVIESACRTRTRIPGDRAEKFAGLPRRSKNIVFSETLNRIGVEVRSLMVVKLRLFLAISTILPVIMLSGLFGWEFRTIRMTYAVACGGMLRVIAEEKVAFMVMPVLSEVTGTGTPVAFRIAVRGVTASLIVCSFLPLPEPRA